MQIKYNLTREIHAAHASIIRENPHCYVFVALLGG